MGLEPSEVFVFGSNLAGRHGAGAAKDAMKFGAQYGRGIGRQGQSYALPTKGNNLRTLALSEIASFVQDFLDYARSQPSTRFLVTRIGCGLAGYRDAEVAPLFAGAPTNVVFLDTTWDALAGRA